jgi:hypothetical protein
LLSVTGRDGSSLGRPTTFVNEIIHEAQTGLVLSFGRKSGGRRTAATGCSFPGYRVNSVSRLKIAGIQRCCAGNCFGMSRRHAAKERNEIPEALCRRPHPFGEVANIVLEFLLADVFGEFVQFDAEPVDRRLGRSR